MKYVKLTLSWIIFISGSLFILLLNIMTFFQAREYCRITVLPFICKSIIKLHGVKLHIHGEIPIGKQFVYIANHTSTWDAFVYAAMGLPRTRFFMAKRLQLFLPLGIIGRCSGYIFTPQQKYPEKRITCFEKAESLLRKSGDSTFLSPEGTRITDGGLGKFNKGAFHLATNLRAPIAPFFVHVPQNENPQKSFTAKACDIHVTFYPPIETAHWKIEDLLENVKNVREFYLSEHNKFNTQSLA